MTFNGNYLINAVGGDGHILEVTPEKEIIWDVFLDLVAPVGNNYRAYRIPSLHPQAFSVAVDEYTIVEGENIVQTANNLVEFTIFNESGYNQSYTYMFSDLTDGGSPMFEYEEGELTIGPWGDTSLSFPVTEDIESTNIGLSIWPVYHDYALKELIFTVIKDNVLSGDINSDGNWNVLDIVTLSNCVLAENCNNR